MLPHLGHASVRPALAGEVRNLALQPGHTTEGAVGVGGVGKPQSFRIGSRSGASPWLHALNLGQKTSLSRIFTHAAAGMATSNP